jgi:hypothetical protein
MTGYEMLGMFEEMKMAGIGFNPQEAEEMANYWARELNKIPDLLVIDVQEASTALIMQGARPSLPKLKVATTAVVMRRTHVDKVEERKEAKEKFAELYSKDPKEMDFGRNVLRMAMLSWATDDREARLKKFISSAQWGLEQAPDFAKQAWQECLDEHQNRLDKWDEIVNRQGST